MGKIKQLTPQLVNLIAAGEVVERPASIVKELIENSVDAGASEIVIKLEKGGIKKIEVLDNGSGMDKEDAIAAFKQHATSKILTEKDLATISTLGFRGEALASISSIATIELETKTTVSEPVKVVVVDQEKQIEPSTKSTNGTRIMVKNIFQNVPVRKKFLRTERTEFKHCQSEFLAAALVYPNIRFELHHNSKITYRLPAEDTLQNRVFAIWDKLTPDKFYYHASKQNNIELEIYIGKPDIARKDRKYQFVFVNGRSVSNRIIQKAVSQAYKGFIHHSQQPVYFIKINMPSEQVDVNVHPRKQEVKFNNPGAIFSMVNKTVKSTLSNQTKQDILERTSRGTIDNKGVSTSDVSHNSYRGKKSSATKPMRSDNKGVTSSMKFTKQLLSPGNAYKTSKTQDTNDKASSSLPRFSTEQITNQRGKQTASTGYSENRSEMTFIRPFQIFNTYILYQVDKNVVFVDQHAAAEKILYEKLMNQVDSAAIAPLLVPELIELSSEDKSQVLEMQPQLEKIGIKLEDFGGDSIQVTAKPAATPNLRVGEFIQQIIEESYNFDSNPELMSEVENPALHDLVASAACHGSIRAGQKLSEPEMVQIISDLKGCQLPYNCPHGRPVSWILTQQELEKNFKRIL